uniref:hypothetical protein n=1 Tax=Paracoccus aminophilus TaxID=34003 RepID=UPI00159EC2FC|nr:hypothetical protein [Paracoccus aminophilus]
MGGAGAGAFGFLFAALMFASPLACLIAVLITWILVLPKWNVAAFVLFLASCALQLIMWNVDLEGIVGQIAFSGSFALSVVALAMIPAALAVRIGALIFAVSRAKQQRHSHPETGE